MPNTTRDRPPPRTVKPFDNVKGFTQLSNALLDFIMPGLSGAEWKVLCYIIRHTSGFRRGSDRISYSQIARGKRSGGRQLDRGAGVTSTGTISAALKRLLEDGYIFKSPGGGWGAHTYTLNPDFEFELEARADPPPASIIEAGATSIFEAGSTAEIEAAPLRFPQRPGPPPTSKIEDTTETDRKKETETDTTHPRAAGAPAAGVVGVGSKYSPEDCRRYAAHLHTTGQGINNPGGFARSIYRSGEYDAAIELFMRGTDTAGPPAVDTSQCPLCEGRGVRYIDPADFSEGVVKCFHEPLARAAGAR